MDKFAPLQISEVTDQTILSCLGSQQLDLSIGTVSYREPNAASTAVQSVRQREDFLQSCFEKENEYFKCLENFIHDPRSMNEKLILKNATQSSNTPDEFIDLKDVNQALAITPENNVLGSTSSYSKNSSLFPGSSILRESDLLSFSDGDEVDLKKETSKFLGLPSYLLGGQSRAENESQITTDDGDREEVSKPWGDETSFGFEVDRLQVDNSTPVQEVLCNEKKSSEVGLQFASAVNENIKNPFYEEEVKQQDEFSSFEFHNPDSRELSLAEENALNSYYIGNSFVYSSSKAEFSGVANPDDISLKSSLWNIESDGTNSTEKINIEDIFKAKSAKTNFGYDIDDKKSYYFEENELEKPLEMPLSSLDDANAFASGVSSNQIAASNFDTQKQFSNINSDSRSEPKIPSILMNNQGEKSITLDSLREMMGRMSSQISSEYPQNITQDPQDLIKNFSKQRGDMLTKESFLSESTAEMLDMKKYRERLSRIIFKDDPQPQTLQSHLGNVMDNVNVSNIDINTLNKMDEASKSTFNKIDETGSEYCKQTNLGERDKTSKYISEYCKETNLGERGETSKYISEYCKETNLGERPEASKYISEYCKETNLGECDETKYISEYCKEANLGEREVVDATRMGNSYQLSASSGWPMDVQKNPNVPIKENNLNMKSLAFGPKQGNLKEDSVISKDVLTGLKTDIGYQIKNPTSELLTLSLKQLDEVFQHANSFQTLNQDSFQFDYPRHAYLFPNSSLNLCFSFCSLMPGIFTSKLRLSLSEVKNVNQFPISQSLQLVIIVQKPDILVTCDKVEMVDFGLVPECCTIRKNILIANRSNHSIPIFVSLKPIYGSNEILTWIENHPGMKLVSPSLAACEIEAESAVTLLAEFNAPSVDILANVLGTEQSSGFLELESSLEVSLDSPFNSTMVLSKIPVKIRIGEVQLRTQRSVLPLKVESIDGQMGSCTCTLRNYSLFPLDVSVKLSDHEQFFSVHPERFSIPSQAASTIEIRFTPTRNFSKLNIEVKLLILVEPEGMQLDLPLVASLIQKSKPEDQLPKLPLVTVEDCSTEDKVSNNPSVNLLTNGHHCMFGSVPIGESKPYKFIIQNGWSDNSLVMQICLQKNNAFYFSEREDGSRVLCNEVKLEPNEKLHLIINFAPSKRKVYVGSLTCIYKNTVGKTTFPLYGFGGSGELILKHGETLLSQSVEIPFGNLTLNVPSMIKLTGTNTGSRYIFVKLAILPDENSDLPFPAFDFCVQPSLLILGPGESKDITIICMSSTSIMERMLEKFGILKVIYGDEILRRRFRSYNNTKLKKKRISNARLLMVNFNEEILRENCVLKDEESDKKCPLLDDDNVVFYNSCKILNIPLFRDLPENDESITMIKAGVDATTMKSFMIQHVEKLLANDKGKEVSNPNQGLPKQAMFKSVDFDVIPPSLMLKTSQNDPVEVSVLNRTDKDQVLEVSCEDSYVSISPTECTVAPNSFTIFKVILITANLPRNLPKLTRTSIHILGPNYQRNVTVTIEIDSNLNNNDKFLQPSKIPVFSQKQQENKLVSVLPLQNPKAQEKNVQSSSKSSNSQSEQRILESSEKEVHFEIPGELKFPNTKFMGESAVKLPICNYSPDPQQVKVNVLGKHFSIRHQNLTVNGKCMVTIPVFFSPTIRGEINDVVKIHVVSNKKPYLVRLSGRCI